MSAAEAAAEIARECDALKAMLLEKNKAYGNSALEPLRVFSRANPVEQLLVRLDDKLSRLARGQHAGEDPELDLLGYLILLRVARARLRATRRQDLGIPPIALHELVDPDALRKACGS